MTAIMSVAGDNGASGLKIDRIERCTETMLLSIIEDIEHLAGT
jgi:hypothetical protein